MKLSSFVVLVCLWRVNGEGDAWLPPYMTVPSEEVDSSEHGGPPGPVPTTCPCGAANKGLSRIVGGVEASVNEYPWAAMLFVKVLPQAPFCGGTLITPRHVITAGHCLLEIVRGNFSVQVVLAGHDYVAERSTERRTADVSDIIIHEMFPARENYDVALLVLEHRVQFDRFASPACLPATKLSLDWQHLKAMGWGRTGWSPEDGQSASLRVVGVRAVPLAQCAPYANVHLDDPHQLCTYGPNKGLGQGDSGGPVVWLDPDTNRYTIVGLPSFVYPFVGQNYRPDVTTDVSSFLPWIRAQIARTDPGVQACWSQKKTNESYNV